ncbi:hypothetical protein MMAD_44650 [Mycolicibacterium madagascariense]|uniref:Uncharacterized protein n=1 Tax=Mycolicibacterium madagascariense TaxID=212765 RepID=A0A7I7XLT2_9MYCO|nr:hypothetical protein MMAD_44650 [Mycolicibacterium madagascariense]
MAARGGRGEGSGQRHGQGAEELQGHGQAETDPGDREVQREIHDREHRRQCRDQRPLPSGERADPGAAKGQQRDRGDPLPDRDDADGTDGGEGQRTHGGSGLVRQCAAQHECATRDGVRSRRDDRAPDFGFIGHDLSVAERRAYMKCMCRIIYTLDA